MKSIFEAIIGRWGEFTNGIAQAISDSNWKAITRYIGLAFVAVLCAIVVAIAILTLVGKILGTLLGKIFALPLMLFILGLSYKVNFEDSRTAHLATNESTMLDSQAEEMYEYVRDALFLVLRAVSEYTNIVPPARASTIEVVNDPYTIENGYVVFNFLVRVCGPIDINQFKRDIQSTLRQMHRAHELNGIPRDLTEINGSYYCPLQVFENPKDFGDYIQVSVVFANEKTVAITRAHKLLNLEAALSARKKIGGTLTDDEL